MVGFVLGLALVGTLLGGLVLGLLESFGEQAFAVNLIESEGWQPDLGALERALKSGARFVLVTNPNNPTGTVTPKLKLQTWPTGAKSVAGL